MAEAKGFNNDNKWKEQSNKSRQSEKSKLAKYQTNVTLKGENKVTNQNWQSNNLDYPRR